MRILDGSLTAFEAEEKAKFDTFIESIENETLEGGNDEYNVMKSNPIVFELMPFYQFELTTISQIAFSVADDPFFKSIRSRYFPEVIVMNMKGDIKGRVNPQNRKYLRKGKEAMFFEDDFREPKLKINDDKRVQINLSALHPKDKNTKSAANVASTSQLSQQSKKSKDEPSYSGKMLLLTVRVYTDAFKNAPVKSGEFDRAWYRLINQDTSQTLDYKQIKDVKTPDNPTDSEPAPEDGADGEASSAAKKSFTYVAGRIYFDHRGNGRWVYEQYNHVFATDKFENGDLPQAMCGLYKRSEAELDEQAELIHEARQKVIQNEEERRQAAIAAAAKKKPGKGGKKEANEDEKKEDEKPKGPPPKAPLDLTKP